MPALWPLVYAELFLFGAVAFFLLPLTTAFAMFAALAIVVLWCYRGKLGTMPACAVAEQTPAPATPTRRVA